MYLFYQAPPTVVSSYFNAAADEDNLIWPEAIKNNNVRAK